MPLLLGITEIFFHHGVKHQSVSQFPRNPISQSASFIDPLSEHTVNSWFRLWGNCFAAVPRWKMVDPNSEDTTRCPRSARPSPTRAVARSKLHLEEETSKRWVLIHLTEFKDKGLEYKYTSVAGLCYQEVNIYINTRANRQWPVNDVQGIPLPSVRAITMSYLPLELSRWRYAFLAIS